MLALAEAGSWALWWPWLTLLAVGLGEALALVFVVRVVQQGRNPAATISWILIIFLTPYIGLILYYLLPRRIQLKKLRLRSARLSGVEESLPDSHAVAARSEHSSDPLIRLVGRLDPEAVHDDNAVKLLGSGQEFVDEFEIAITAARHSIHLEVYILRPDATGLALLDRLTEAAGQGIEVRVLYDSVGSWWLREHHLEKLHQAGGRSAAFMPLLWRRRPFTLNLRNHRKLLIVDGDIGFIGGRNVGDEYAKDRFGKEHKWLDAVLRIDGPVVSRMQRMFVQDWHTATEELVTDPIYFPQRRREGGHTAMVVEGGPDSNANQLHWTFFQLLVAAREKILISSPYLVPDRTLLCAMAVGASRGVEITIHTNGPSAEHFMMYWAKRAYYRELLEAGVRITETRNDYNHSKLVAVDDKYLFIGSPNLDVRSEELNFEVGAVVVDERLCREAVDLCEVRMADGRTMTLADLSCTWYARLAQGIGRLVSPLL